MGTTRRSTGVFPAIPRFLCWDIGPLAHTLHTTKTPEGRSATFRVQGSGFFSLLLFLVFECYFLFVFFEKYLWASIAARSLKPFWPKKKKIFFLAHLGEVERYPSLEASFFEMFDLFLFCFFIFFFDSFFVVVKKTGKNDKKRKQKKKE